MNAKQHMIIGAAAGIAVNVALQLLEMQEDRQKQFDWGELLMVAGLGAGAGLLPDILEPATDPNHRKFFHSMVAGGLVGYACCGDHTSACSRATKILLLTVAVAYCSHLAADATTPRGIRFA